MHCGNEHSQEGRYGEPSVSPVVISRDLAGMVERLGTADTVKRCFPVATLAWWSQESDLGGSSELHTLCQTAVIKAS